MVDEVLTRRLREQGFRSLDPQRLYAKGAAHLGRCWVLEDGGHSPQYGLPFLEINSEDARSATVDVVNYVVFSVRFLDLRSGLHYMSVPSWMYEAWANAPLQPALWETAVFPQPSKLETIVSEAASALRDIERLELLHSLIVSEQK